MPESQLQLALNWKKKLAEAKALIESKEYKRALVLLDDVLKMAEALSGEDFEDLRIADTLERMAFSYHCLGRFEEAEPLYRRAIKIAEPRLFGIDTEEASTENLANLLAETERAAEGEELREAIRRKYPKNQPQTNVSIPSFSPENSIMSTLDSLARKEPNRIIPMMNELLELIETVYGADSMETVGALESLGDRSGMGAEYHERALRIKQRRLKNGNEDDEAAVAYSMRKLADIHTDPALRRALLAKARSIEKKLGITNVYDQTLIALQTLTGQKADSDMPLAEAEAILAAREQQTQDEPPYVEMTITRERRYKQLGSILEKSLAAVFEMEEGQEYPLTTICMLSAAKRVYEEFGDIELAKGVMQKEMKIIAEHWGDGHSMMVDTYEEYERLCNQ